MGVKKISVPVKKKRQYSPSCECCKFKTAYELLEEESDEIFFDNFLDDD